MNAIQAKSSKARATIARNLMVNNTSGNMGRNFDDCFEMGDGEQVIHLLTERLATDIELRDAAYRLERYMPHSFMAVVRSLPRPTPEQLLDIQFARMNKRLNRYAKLFA